MKNSTETILRGCSCRRVDEKNRFDYRSVYIPFQEEALGEVFDRMARFISGTEKRFLAYAITGPAGAGKSRFALELCSRIIGWDAGFLADTPEDMVWRDWQPQSPTLIVIDYIGSRNIGRVLKILSQRNNLNHPVRMLLLEREGIQQRVKEHFPKWFQDILACG